MTTAPHIIKALIGLVTFTSLAACGFTPLHAPHPQSSLGSPISMAGLHGAVNITFSNKLRTDQSTQRAQILLRQALITRLGEPNGAARYELSLSPKFTRQAVGVTTDYIDSRYDLRLNIDFSLIDLQSQAQTETQAQNTDKSFATSLEAITTFGAPSNPYALNAAQDLAEENLAREASDRLILRLSRYLKIGS